MPRSGRFGELADIVTDPVISPDLLPLITVLGPTGSGKSELALALALYFSGEIVSFDSVQLYRGLDIGSAKIPISERCGVPHHLIDVADPGDDITAGQYARTARAILADVAGRKEVPVLVGGTGFYLRALLDGLSPAPNRNDDLRKRLAEIRNRRPGGLHRLLRSMDVLAAARIHPHDHQKIVRAIEVNVLSKRSCTAVLAEPRRALSGFRVLKLGLAPQRSRLHERLNQRAAAMFANGLLAETQGILDRGVPVTAKALQSLGYKQALAVLAGTISITQAVEQTQLKTRQYAKRQMTWFRAESGVQWLEGFGSDATIQAEAREIAEAFLSSGYGRPPMESLTRKQIP